MPRRWPAVPLGFALRHPAALLATGRLLCAAASVLAMLGLRIDRLLHLFSHGAKRTSVEDFLPSWLVWAIPESLLGWLLVGMLFSSGFCVAQAARTIARRDSEQQQSPTSG